MTTEQSPTDGSAIDLLRIQPWHELGAEIYPYRTETEELTALYYPGLRNLWIGQVYVDPSVRRRGRARAMLDAAVNLAESLGAQTIGATIETDDGYWLFATVFGPQYLDVYSYDEFKAKGTAMFSYDLQETDPRLPSA